MKRAPVLFLSMIFCVVSAAQDLPPEILVDQYLLEATRAMENDEPGEAFWKFMEIEELDVEPPAEFLFFYGKFLVENSFPVKDHFLGDFKERLDYLLTGDALLKQYVLSIERGSERYAAVLELLSVAAEKVDERQEQLASDEYATEQAMLKPMGEMVSIPGGTFQMGDLSGEGLGDERPVHTVTVRPFKLGRYEVTFAQWDACVADGVCNPDGNSWVAIDQGWGRGNRPVINVSWDDAQLFIDWLNTRTGGGYRLPSEAEWEYAARAGSTTEYSWGDDIGNSRANCYGCGSQWDNEQTAPVGSFPANAWGLHDMHGNMFEWVQDCWHDNYEGAPSDGGAWTSNCSDGDGGVENYDDESTLRVFRGGSWDFPPAILRSALRLWDTRSNRSNSIGFRLAQDE